MLNSRPAREAAWVLKIAFGALLFGLGFDLFLEPSNINCGGVSGVAMIVKKLSGKDTMLGMSTISLLTFVLNVPLFLGGFKAIGRRYFVGSLLGVVFGTLLLNAFYPLEALYQGTGNRLLDAVVGGFMLGLGVGIVVQQEASTGGSDIVARLLKLRFPDFPIGALTMAVNAVIILGTGLAYKDLNNSIYSAVTIYVSTQTIDMVVYRFDYSKVALIITDRYDEVAQAIDVQVHRGVTFLQAKGYYRHNDKFVLLCAVRRHQLSALQKAVVSVDPQAFIIIQEAHQVLGDGFKHYSEKGL